MSTNIRVKKVCDHCGGVFTAKTLVTRYCSHRCNQRAYKDKQREAKLVKAAEITRQSPFSESETSDENKMINIKQMAAIIGLGERTLYRLMKDDDFPKIKVGARLLFNKADVIHFINHKYSSV